METHTETDNTKPSWWGWAACVALCGLILVLWFISADSFKGWDTFKEYSNELLLKLWFHVVLTILVTLWLVQGAYRSVIWRDSAAINFFAVMFGLSVVVSFVQSPYKMYLLIPDCYSRLLWPLVVMMGVDLRRFPKAALAIRITAITGIVLYLATFGIGQGNLRHVFALLAAAAAGWWFHRSTEFGAGPSTELRAGDDFPWKRAAVSLAAIILILAVSTIYRAVQSEYELVRQNLAEEQTAHEVGMAVFTGHPAIGTAPGSYEISMNLFRPTHAESLGVRVILSKPVHLPAALLTEQGILGLASFIGLVVVLLATARLTRPTPVTPALGAANVFQSICVGIVVFILFEQFTGQGWMLDDAFALPALLLLSTLGRPPAHRSSASPIMFTNAFAVLAIIAFFYHHFGESVSSADRLCTMARREMSKNTNEGYNTALRYVNEGFGASRYSRKPYSTALMLFMTVGDRGSALDIALKQRDADPYQPELDQNIGTLYMFTKQYAKAAEHFEKYVRRDPGVISFSRLAQTYYVAGQGQQALDMFVKTIEAYPRESKLLMARADRMPDAKELASAFDQAAKFALQKITQMMGEERTANYRRAYEEARATLNPLLGPAG